MLDKALRSLLAWVIGQYSRILGATIRWVVHDDPRPALRAAGQSYVYGCLHAHQVAALMGHGEERCACILSRSADGDLLAGALHAHRITPMRGSSRKDGVDKGGREAMQRVIDWVCGGAPATITVDGPRGPRGVAKAGLATVAVRAGACVVSAVLVPRRRWILSKTWDRLQIPKLFTRIDIYFAAPLCADAAIRDERERIAELTARIEQALRGLESRHDGVEHLVAKDHVARRLATQSAATPQA